MRCRIAAGVASFALFACGSGPEERTLPSAAPTWSVESLAPSASVNGEAAPSAAATPASSAVMGEDENKGKRRKFGDAAVFVDGAPRGVLRVLELPAQVPRRDATLVDGRKVARWRLAEYLTQVGVDLARLREIHVLGGRGRTAIVSGAEVRRLKDSLLFSFTRGATGGKPRIHWPSDIKTNTTIDVVGAICAYVDKAPPRYDKDERALYDAQGVKFDGIPYVPAEAIPRGTRVYLDGRYEAAIKKKLLPDALLAPDSTPAATRFSLAKYLLSLRIDASRATAIDLVDGDAFAARIDPPTWAKIAQGASFAVDAGSRGRASLRIPDPPPGLPAELLISAVLVHLKPPPPLPRESLPAKERTGSREPQVDSPMP